MCQMETIWMKYLRNETCNGTHLTEFKFLVYTVLKQTVLFIQGDIFSLT